jgi:hypothetical protein
VLVQSYRRSTRHDDGKHGMSETSPGELVRLDPTWLYLRFDAQNNHVAHLKDASRLNDIAIVISHILPSKNLGGSYLLIPNKGMYWVCSIELSKP